MKCASRSSGYFAKKVHGKTASLKAVIRHSVKCNSYCHWN